ncbi:retrovirus-related pol polyprotein from transposon TNT 1-94 [Tanacetum coccineum]
MDLGYQNPFYLKKSQQKQQSLYNGKVLLEMHDPPDVYDSEETLELTQESLLKMKQLNKEIQPANYTKINHLSGVFVSQTAKSHEELYFSNTSKTANVSNSISIQNEEFSDDTTPSVARKFLNEIHKIVKDEIFPIVNQVNARVQNFKIQFLKEAAKFVRDFQSLAKEADESLTKHKAFELEIKRLLRAVVSQDIMSIVHNNSVVYTSNLQTELERTKERFENCIIKKENEYAKLWNDWYKKCEECKYDKISYDKAYNDMQQMIERLQAQLGDHKGKSKDTSCVSDTLDPLPQKLENENLELEFQVRNYEKENAHLKTAYKNLFDSINVSEQKDTTKGTSTNTKFANQSTERKPSLKSLRNTFIVRQPNAFQSERLNFSKTRVPQKVDKTNDLSNPVTSNSIPTTKESKVVENDKVVALGILRINPFKASRVDDFVPNKHVKASIRTKSITVSQPHVITKNDVDSKTNGFSPKDVKSTTRTRRPLPRNNPKNDKVPSKFKSSWLLNNLYKIEENHRNLQSSSNQKHMSSECNNIKLAIRNAKSKVVCAMCKQCLRTVNHDVCVLNYVNDMNSHALNKNENVENVENQKKHKPNVRKPKKVLQRNGFYSIFFLGSYWEPSALEISYAAILGYGVLYWEKLLNPPGSKDKAPEKIKTFLKKIIVLLQALVIIMLVEAARTMLIFSRAPLFLWAEVIAITCYTQNRSIIHRRFDKTPYELINSKKPDVSFLHVFGALCYPKNDREDSGKLGAKGDIGFFIGYSTNSCAYRVYNRRTKKIIKTMNVTFDEISVMAFEQRS